MIAFNNFKAHYDAIKDAVDESVRRVLASGWYVLGKEVASFEEAFAAFLGAKHAVGVASGTDAITLALMGLGVGAGDEVITTNLTAYPTITGIKRAGATPVVVDVDADTGLLDPALLARRLTGRTRAIVPVHLYGQACDLDPILRFAAGHGLVVVEDCAQSVDALYRGRQTGTLGQAGAYSFYPTKNLGAFGDGGAVATSSSDLRDRLLMLRNYGQKNRYVHEGEGLNSRLDELQAAVLSAKLAVLPAWTARRRAIAAFYRANLTTVAPLVERDYGRAVYHLFPVRCERRDAFIEHLKARSIQTLIHYPVPVHHQPDFRGQQGESLPVSERLCATLASLPLYPELSDAEVELVVAAANHF